MKKKMTTSYAKEAIDTRFKLWEIVKTPFGLGRVQYYLLDKGEIKLVVSLSENVTGVKIDGGIWKLLFLDPSKVEKYKGVV